MPVLHYRSPFGEEEDGEDEEEGGYGWIGLQSGGLFGKLP